MVIFNSYVSLPEGVLFFVFVGFSSFESVCQVPVQRIPPFDVFSKNCGQPNLRVSRFKDLQQDMGMGENHFETYEITI